MRYIIVILIWKRKDRVYKKWKYKVPQKNKSYLKCENIIYQQVLSIYIYIVKKKKLLSIPSNKTTYSE